jgi:hypothetical protein
MDEASLAALRRTIEVGLGAARSELARRQDELAEGRDALHRSYGARQALELDRSRWEESVRALSGHTLSGQELAALRARGEAIEARRQDVARRHAAAQALVARAETALEEGLRAVGEHLARQRWVDEESRRARESRERQASLREDED